jgi:hypothetical protein
MSASQGTSEEKKVEVSGHIAELSRLLGMMPSDPTMTMQGPLMQSEAGISDWLSAIRMRFLKLSTFIGNELKISMQ